MTDFQAHSERSAHVRSFRELLRALKPSKDFLRKASLVSFLASVLIPFAFEYLPEFLEFGPSSHRTWRSLQSSPLYQWLSTLGPRKPRSHFVRLIIFRPGNAPPETMIEHNPCPQRAFTARLIRVVASANPAAIVIDKKYSPHVDCNGTQTSDLTTTINGISPSIPIIVGADDRTADEIRNEPPELREKLMKERALVLFPTLPFDKHVRLGILRLDVDNRRIPLDWPIYDSISTVSTGHLRPAPSLAITVVQLMDPTTLSEPRMTALRRYPDFPFTSFLTEAQIGSYAPESIVCMDNKEDWKTCTPPNVEFLRNRIIVIGDDSAADYHTSVIGDVPGVILQANYIESLLDDRYLYPAPWYLNLLLSVAWVIIIEYFFDKLPLFWALITSVTFTLTFGVALYDILIVQFGAYILLLPPSVLVIVIKLIERWHEARSQTSGQQNTATQQKTIQQDTATSEKSAK